MINCPKCYLQHKDDVEICDCGYVFKERKKKYRPYGSQKKWVMIGRIAAFFFGTLGIFSSFVDYHRQVFN